LSSQQTVFESWGVNLPPDDRLAPFDRAVVGRLEGQAQQLQITLEHKSDHLPLLQHALQVLWDKALARWNNLCNKGGDCQPRISVQDLDNALPPPAASPQPRLAAVRGVVASLRLPTAGSSSECY
jgi:hypothetical protein